MFSRPTRSLAPAVLLITAQFGSAAPISNAVPDKAHPLALSAVRLTGGPLETFGDGSVSVRYSGGGQAWTQLAATVSVQGKATPVTEGAARVTKAAGILRIPLMDESVLLPRGKKLVVRIAASSKDGVFHAPAGQGNITIGRVTLNLSLLKRAVSR